MIKRLAVLCTLLLLTLTGCGKIETLQNSNPQSDGQDYMPPAGDARSTVEANALAEWIGANKVEESSFETTINAWGQVEFASCLPDCSEGSNPLTDASFYLLKGDQIVYRFPDAAKDNVRESGSCDSIPFAFLADTDHDDLDDIVIAVSYVSGAGPQGMIPYTELRIYEDRGDVFAYNRELSDKLNKRIPQNASLEDVKLLLHEETSTIDFERLGVKRHSYPSGFSMGDDLQAAITQLSLYFEAFDGSMTEGKDWKAIFVERFIQNSRMSFAYLDQCANRNHGEIGIDELNYIQYSLTGEEVDFSDLTRLVNAYDTSSTVNYGWITDWSYEETGGEVTVTASLEIGYGQLRENDLEERELTVRLAKNPYSCFDGYSILSLTSKVITPWVPEIAIGE